MKVLFAAAACVMLAAPVFAQFTGPSAPRGQVATVAEANALRAGTYVTVTGNILSHQREAYYTFGDGTGEIRVEISRRVWRGQEVTPSTPVQIFGEVDRGLRGRYIYVETLTLP